MKNCDNLTRDDIRAKLQQAIKDNDTEAFPPPLTRCWSASRATSSSGPMTESTR